MGGLSEAEELRLLAERQMQDGQLDEAEYSLGLALGILAEINIPDELTDRNRARERGLVELCITKVYLSQLQLEPDDADLEMYLAGAILSAADYLRTGPEAEEVQALLNQFMSEPWWEAAVARLEH